MTDRPIIFSAPMVRALLDGRKTQTRRVLKPQPPADAYIVWCYTDNPPRPALRNTVGWFVPEAGDLWPCSDDDRIKLPYAIGDRLWVREAWAHDADSLEDCRASAECVMNCGVGDYGPYYRATEVAPDTLRWRSPIHMPRWASRLTLTVTDVRVQRVQEINAEDVTAEGIPFEAGALAPYEWSISRFADLWNSLHGADAWDQNPYVAAISFTVERRNIDA